MRLLVALRFVGEANSILVDDDGPGIEGKQQWRNFIVVANHAGIIADGATEPARHITKIGVAGASCRAAVECPVPV
jgi:hypothetical protein